MSPGAEEQEGWRLSRGACLLLLALLALLPDLLSWLPDAPRFRGYAAFLRTDVGPLKEDFGNIFLPKLYAQLDALRAGKLLLWNPYQYAGTAHWPLPNTAPAYPPLVLLVLLLGPLGGLNVSVLLHVLFGMAGTFLLAERWTGSRFAGFFAGLAFVYARFTFQLAYVLPWELMAVAWVPWTLLLLARAVDEDERPFAWTALAAGACYSGVAWSGGYITLMRAALVLGVVVTVRALHARERRRVLRAAAVLVLFVAAFLAFSAARLLPTWEWIPLTNRNLGLVESAATESVFSARDWVYWYTQEGWLVVGMALFGAWTCWRRRESWGVGLVAALVLVTLLSMGIGFEWMREWLPGVNMLRGPRRFWILTLFLLPLLAAFVAREFSAAAVRERRATLRTAALFVLLFLVDKGAHTRFRVPVLSSLEERVEQNALHLELARRKQEEPRLRVHDYADTNAGLKRTADLVRARLRLESLESILGNIAIQAYDRDYLIRSAKAPARMWGFLACRYVTSEVELEDEPGLRLVEKFDEDPRELHRGTDGPYLYENLECLPRAALAEHALLLINPGWKHWQTLCAVDCWDPATTVAVRARSDDLLEAGPDFFRRFDAILFYGDGDEAVPDAVREDILASGTEHMEILRTRASSATRWIQEATADCTAPLVALPAPELEWNRSSVTLPAGAADGDGRLLFLAETFSLYPGWEVRVDGEPAALFTANCAASAVWLPPGAREVTLRYTPPGFRMGWAITLGAWLLAAVLAGLRRISRRSPLRIARGEDR